MATTDDSKRWTTGCDLVTGRTARAYATGVRTGSEPRSGRIQGRQGLLERGDEALGLLAVLLVRVVVVGVRTAVHVVHGLAHGVLVEHDHAPIRELLERVGVQER